MKTCRTCKQEKPLSEYHKDCTYPGGSKNICRPCAKIVYAKWSAKKKEIRGGQKCTKCKVFKTYDLFDLNDSGMPQKRTCKKCSEKYQPWGYATRHINWMISAKLA